MRSLRSASDSTRCATARVARTACVVRAQHIGDRVPGRACGRVHSVFERACNIETHTGELVVLLAQELGNVPHGIRLVGQLAPFSSWMFAGGNVHLDNASLHLPGLIVDVSGAAVWRGLAVAVSMHPCNSNTARALREMRATLCARAPQHGIAPLLVAPAGASVLDQVFATRLFHTLPLLAHGTQRHDVATVAGAFARLIGLGPGLTPSGDDFLAGYLAALWSRAAFEGAIDAMLQPLADALAPLFVRTNEISRQMLRDATQGRFAESLGNVTACIAGVGDVVEATARALTSGHSSGADTLCGLLFGYTTELAVKEVPAPRDRRPAELPRCASESGDAGRTVPIAC